MGKIKIVLWGTGKYGELAYNSLIQSECKIIKVIDSAKDKVGTTWHNILIDGPECLGQIQFDWLIIAIKETSAIMKMDIVNALHDKVIRFAEDDLSKYRWINDACLTETRQEQSKDIKKNRLLNKKYENAISGIEIKDARSCLEKIKNTRASMARYGDGEFEIMNNQPRPWFQQPNMELGKRLKEIIKNEDNGIIVAIPDQFESLEKYTEDAADSIRSYMVKSRESILNVLDKNKVYYDTYVSRPYLIYKDKMQSLGIFSLWKEIWHDRDVVIIEGANTRNGIGNDLFADTRSIKRVICPVKNAYDKYDEILDMTCKYISKDSLILISLGPTATVLAYDLYRNGYQAIDIGQIDNEYEWFLAKSDKRIHIKGKAVPEIGEQSVIDAGTSEEYKKEIIINLS